MSATRGWRLRLKAQPDFRVDFGGVLPVAQGRSRGELMDELLTWEVVQASPQGLERATDDELARYLSYLKSTIGKSARERLAFSDWQRSTA